MSLLAKLAQENYAAGQPGGALTPNAFTPPTLRQTVASELLRAEARAKEMAELNELLEKNPDFERFFDLLMKAQSR